MAAIIKRPMKNHVIALSLTASHVWVRLRGMAFSFPAFEHALEV